MKQEEPGPATRAVRLAVELIVSGGDAISVDRCAQAVQAALDVALDDDVDVTPVEGIAGCMIESHTVHPEPSRVRAALATVEEALRHYRHWKPSMAQALYEMAHDALENEMAPLPPSTLDAIEILLAGMPMERPEQSSFDTSPDGHAVGEAVGRWQIADQLRKIIGACRREEIRRIRFEPAAPEVHQFPRSMSSGDIARAMGFGDSVEPDLMTMVEVEGRGITSLDTYLENNVEDEVERSEIRKCIAGGHTYHRLLGRGETLMIRPVDE
jgi:hypothetical protein